VLTYGRLLANSSTRLGDRLEARRILESAAGLSSAALIRSLDDGVPFEVVDRVAGLVARRAAGEPLQHVVGRWGFRSLDVRVDNRALVPRPETELLVDLALTALATASAPTAVDLGTGSGVIALSLAAEHPSIEVFAVDASDLALELAGENLASVTPEAASRVHLLHGSWFDALPPERAGSFDFVVANPPYLAESEWAGLDRVVREYDPYEALVAGPTGLEAIAAIVSGAPSWLAAHGALLVEIAPHQAGAAAQLARGAGFGQVDVVDDLAGRPRVLRALGRRPSR
jgi:release factor glutamine methyltransferase